MSDLIKREDAIEALCKGCGWKESQCDQDSGFWCESGALIRRDIPSADRPQGEWIPCSERLPKIGERVLLATNCGTVVIGHRDKPDLIWQVTEKGDKHWVYDPEAYTDDVDSLPKGEDCAFSQDTDYGDGFLSVTSLNYNPRFEGVIAWMPLPKPYGERKGE